MGRIENCNSTWNCFYVHIGPNPLSAAILPTHPNVHACMHPHCIQLYMHAAIPFILVKAVRDGSVVVVVGGGGGGGGGGGSLNAEAGTQNTRPA